MCKVQAALVGPLLESLDPYTVLRFSCVYSMSIRWRRRYLRLSSFCKITCRVRSIEPACQSAYCNAGKDSDLVIHPTGSGGDATVLFHRS